MTGLTEFAGLTEFKKVLKLDKLNQLGNLGQLKEMKKKIKTYTISAVAELFEIHPQTLRLYEREGLLKPSRSEGNTRLYEDSDIERLEIILSLTRDLGVNLAGVEIILNMREKMDTMQREFERFFEYLRTHADEFSNQSAIFTDTQALIPISRVTIKRSVHTYSEDK